VVKEVVAAFIARLVLNGLYETTCEVEWSYRERLELLGCDGAFIESAIENGRNAACHIRSQVEPMN
jgi:hypothetical protein